METRFGLADFTYCLSKHKTKQIGDMEILQRVADLGLECFQAGLATDAPGGGAEQRRSLHTQADALGVELVGAGGGLPTQALFEKEVGAAAELGARVLRHACSLFRWKNTTAPAAELAEALVAAAPAAEKAGVIIAIENHQDYTCEELADVMRRVDSPFVGICLDTGNSMSMLEHPLHTARVLAPYTRSVHLKEYVLLPHPGGFRMVGVTLGRGIVPNEAIMDLLREEAAADPLYVTLENPLESIPAPVLTTAYVDTFPDRTLGSARPILGLLERSIARYPNGVELPGEAGLSEEEVAAAEEEHNRAAVKYAREELGL